MASGCHGNVISLIKNVISMALVPQHIVRHGDKEFVFRINTWFMLRGEMRFYFIRSIDIEKEQAWLRLDTYAIEGIWAVLKTQATLPAYPVEAFVYSIVNGDAITHDKPFHKLRQDVKPEPQVNTVEAEYTSEIERVDMQVSTVQPVAVNQPPADLFSSMPTAETKKPQTRAKKSTKGNKSTPTKTGEDLGGVTISDLFNI